MSGLTPRHQQVLDIIQSDPTRTLQEIADIIGVSRERVRQISDKLQDGGVISDRCELRAEAIDARRRLRIVTRERRKQIWMRMMFVAHRTRLRSLGHIDHTGMVRGYHMPGEETVCQFDGCTQPVDARGFCVRHYVNLRKTGALWVRRQGRSICDKDGCDLPVYARNMCYRHYSQWQRKTLGEDRERRGVSKYLGVTRTRYTRNRWTAFIGLPGRKQEYLGSFESEEMAARAYDTAARKYRGEQAKLNFPNENIEVVREKRVVVKQPPSGYRGISWHDSRKRWQVIITRDGKEIYVGRFTDLEAAARAQDSAAYHYFGSNAKLNFPDESPAPYVPAGDRAKKARVEVVRNPRATGASGYHGVWWSKSRQKWEARLYVNGKNEYIGRFEDKEGAARAYDKAALERFGSAARLNFPEIHAH